MHRHQFTICKLQTKNTFQNRTGGDAISIATKVNTPKFLAKRQRTPKFRRILTSPLDHGARKARPGEGANQGSSVPLPRDPEFERPPRTITKP